jgi:hypothetical protein
MSTLKKSGTATLSIMKMRINNHLITQPNMQVTWILMNTWSIDLLLFNTNEQYFS